jgi:surfactin synthase thioesterase subunit
MRLFCFPHAGGGALAYRSWQGRLPAEVEVCPVQLPGREGRFRERPFRSLDDLLPTLVEQLLPLLDRPFVLFGHSLGGLIAFELCRVLRRRDLPGPVHLIVSGRSAPHLGAIHPLYHLPDDQLLDGLRRLNDDGDAALENAEVMALMMPLLRADLEMCDTYVYRSEAPLSVGITALAGSDDPLATPGRVEVWQQETTGTFTMHTFTARHLFLKTHQAEVLHCLRQLLLGLLGSLPSAGAGT